MQRNQNKNSETEELSRGTWCYHTAGIRLKANRNFRFSLRN